MFAITWTGVGAIAAVLSAVVAAFGLYLRYRERVLSQRPRIKTSLDWGFTGYPGQKPTSVLFLTAANTGLVPVNLSYAGLKITKTNYSIALLPDNLNVVLPFALEPYNSHTVRIEQLKLGQTLEDNGYTGVVEMCAVFKDKLDNEYKSKPEKYAVQTLLSQD